MATKTARRRALLGRSLLLVLLGGCAASGRSERGPSGPAPEAPAAAEEPTRRLATANGDYMVECSARPDPIPLNAPFELEIRVRRADGAPVEDIELEVDARMPAHRHGMNTAARVERLPDGRFRARGLLLHMSGHWEVYLDVTRDGTTDRAQFDLRF